MFNSCIYINLEILHKVYSESVACFETHARRMRRVQQDWLPASRSGRNRITEQGEAETFLDSGCSMSFFAGTLLPFCFTFVIIYKSACILTQDLLLFIS